MVPATWKIFRTAADPTPPTIVARLLRLHSVRTAINRALQQLGQFVLLRVAVGKPTQRRMQIEAATSSVLGASPDLLTAACRGSARRAGRWSAFGRPLCL